MDKPYYTMYVDTTLWSRIYFLSIDKMFQFINDPEFSDKVIGGYIGPDTEK